MTLPGWVASILIVVGAGVARGLIAAMVTRSQAGHVEGRHTATAS